MEHWYLICNAQRVKTLIEEEGKHLEVYLTVIGSGSPEDVIISGKTEACQLMITNLKCRAVKIKDSLYVHTPIMDAYKSRLADVIRKNEIHIMKSSKLNVYRTEK